MTDAEVVVRPEYAIVEADDGRSTVIVQDRVEIVSVGIQGPAGPQGASGNSLPAIYFAYGDATPSTIFTPSGDQIITSITLVITQAFNGVGAKVSIGVTGQPELLMAENDSDLSQMGSYEVDPETEIASGVPVRLFITPGAGASQGQGTILIGYAEA